MKIRLIIALFFLGFAFSSKATDNTVDSLINLTVNENQDTTLVQLYNNIGSVAYKVDQKLAKQYWEKAYSFANKKLKEVRDTFYLNQLAISNNGLGIISRRMGNYSDALSYYQASLKLNEELGNVGSVASNYGNIAIIYRDMEEFDVALDYFQKCLNERLAGTDTIALAVCYNGFGILYRRMKNFEKALEYYNKSLELSAIMDDDENVAQSYSNIAVIHTLNKDYPKALEYFEKGYEIHNAKSNEAGVAKYYANMTSVYDRMGNTKKAIEFGELAHMVYIEMERKNDISIVASKLSNLYKKTKDYKKALSFFKEYIVYRDSVFNEKTTKEVTEKAMQYEFDKQTMSDSLARAEIEKITALEHQQEIKQQRILMYGGGFILLLVIIFSIVVYNRLKISNRQKATIEKQKLLVEIKNKEITDSINYAKRIQSAILPSIDQIKESLPNSFVFYKPKDIVAGDFYWYKKVNNKIFIAVADCTGHGVPGAMVSVVCNNALNRAVNDFWLLDPAKILDKTAELVIEAFKSNKEEDVKDGMDISLCSFDIENNKLEFAGAINSMFYIRGNQLEEIKGDKQPIGQFVNIKPFTLHKLNLAKGDKIYLFSDGYADQFGGVKGKKFMYRRFRELILGVSSKEFSTQKNELELEFKNWRKDIEQLDDVCVVGIEV
jgi:serine phosphatase RsbU (regulator of sigma subunit)/tetratricopeptide (TPR) repeat protein